MNKFRNICVLLILPVFLTACTHNTTPESSSTETIREVVENPVETNEFISGSFADLLEMQIPSTCTFDYTDPDSNTRSVGTLYVSGENFKGEVDVTVDGQTQHTNVLKSSDFAYMWNSGETQGIKMNFTDVALNETDPTPSTEDSGDVTSTENLNLNASYDFNCSAWIPDNKKFEIPSEITFVDFAEQMKMMLENTGQ